MDATVERGSWPEQPAPGGSEQAPLRHALVRPAHQPRRTDPPPGRMASPCSAASRLACLGLLLGLGHIPAELMEHADMDAAHEPGWSGGTAPGPARGPPGSSARPDRDNPTSTGTGPQGPGSTRTGHGRRRGRRARGAAGGHRGRCPAPGGSGQRPNRRRSNRSVPARDEPAGAAPGPAAHGPG